MISRSDVPDIFNIFHDGTMTDVHTREGTCTFKVQIPYLANRIKKDHTFFRVSLENASILKFLGWPRKFERKEKEAIFSFDEIFSTNLEILESNEKAESFEVICNIADLDSDFCGGELHLNCSQAIVLDEDGREWTIDDLDILCKEYWNEWSKKNERV
ncbi:hypothetical protein [Pelagicoccus mobilis]|uniref:Uncharacterized protein n=1 Tax=Pelagicoccus mobilis TaxID=415221 RepID=A0A934S8B0_9BACT|nr:hypothetical protein [Pelagicoccus mobilis]MBK1880683.1 hypothetical protein [Pelagicoccus mobilis]